MPNALHQHPIRITEPMTAGHQESVGAEQGSISPVAVKMITWVGPEKDGDTFTIVDPISDAVRFTARCSNSDAGRTLQFSVNATWKDYRVSQLSSGTLLIS